MDTEKSSASAHPSTPDVAASDLFILAARHRDQDEQDHRCFYCLEGWVFLGSVGHDGEEITEAIRCRRCNASETR